MRKWLYPLFLFFVLAMLLLDPSRYFRSVQSGLLLFTSAVLPSMLPYFFFTKLLTGTGCVTVLAGKGGRPVSRLYRVAPIASYPLLMSVLSGYPVGARVLGDLHKKGLISDEDAVRAASFTSTSGSMFVLGSVGAVILRDGKAAVVILIAHYLGALINGLLYRGKKRKGQAIPLPIGGRSANNLLSEAMYESVLSLALVCGFIALTGLLGDMAADLLSRIGLGSFFSGGTIASAFLYSAFEVTRGCVEFASLGMGRVWTAACACLAVSFGGISVVLQSMAFLGKTGLKQSKFLLMKITQGGISFLIAAGLGAIVL